MTQSLLEATAPPAPSGRGRLLRSGPTARTRRLLVVGAVAVGALLRLLQYAVPRSLWLDEAFLASSLVERGWAGLLRPLDYGQTAPFGFLLLERAAVAALGAGEYALRLVPLLAGLAALALFVPLARRAVSAAAVPLAVGLFALAPFLVYYASEVKQYSMDVLATVVLLSLAIDVARRPPTRGRMLAFAAAGVVAAWLAQASIFVLAGVGIVLGIRVLRRRETRAAAALAGVGAAWLASFTGAYAVARRGLQDADYIAAFWSDGFLPVPPSSAAEWLWLPERLASLFREPLGAMGDGLPTVALVGQVAGALAFVAGVAWMARRRPLILALLLAPLGMALVASALRVYPFGGPYLSAGRVLLFLVPPLVLVMAEGAASLRRVGATAGRAAFALLALAMLAPSLAFAGTGVPLVRGEVKPLLAFTAENRAPGDVLYVHHVARAPVRYYAPRYGWGPADVVMGSCSRLRPSGYLREIDALAGRPRVWVMFLDVQVGKGSDEKRLILDYLDHLGTRVDDRVSIGASVYLYDLSRAGQAGPFPRRIPIYASDADMECRGPWQNAGRDGVYTGAPAPAGPVIAPPQPRIP